VTDIPDGQKCYPKHERILKVRSSEIQGQKRNGEDRKQNLRDLVNWRLGYIWKD
jgi:hypothetical protein